MSDETQVTDEPTTVSEEPTEPTVAEPEPDEPTEPEEESTESDDQPDEGWLDQGLEVEDDDNDIPELRLDDPEAQKVWKTQWDGVIKKERQLTEREAAVQEQENLVSQARQINDAFADKHSAKRLVEVLIQAGTDQFGSDFFPAKKEDDLWNDFDAPRKEQGPDPLELLRQVGLDPAEIKAVIESQKEQKAKAALHSHLRTLLPSVQRAVSQAVPGVMVTEDDVINAVEQRPYMKDRPDEAVLLYKFTDFKKGIYQKARGTKKMPDLPKAGQRSGGVSDSLESIRNNFPPF